MTRPFSLAQVQVIRWAAEECQRQRSGELSVSWMIDAWSFAKRAAQADSSPRRPTEDDVLGLARLVDPFVNAEGYRRVGVRVGADVKGPWQEVPRQMGLLIDAIPRLTPEEWWDAFERIHPFRDGNGRVGSLVFNWLRGSLDEPVHSPDWDDPAGYWGGNVSPASLADRYRDLESRWAAAETMWDEYVTKRGTTL